MQVWLFFSIPVLRCDRHLGEMQDGNRSCDATEGRAMIGFTSPELHIVLIYAQSVVSFWQGQTDLPLGVGFNIETGVGGVIEHNR